MYKLALRDSPPANELNLMKHIQEIFKSVLVRSDKIDIRTS
jgi:hypothetical protein